LIGKQLNGHFPCENKGGVIKQNSMDSPWWNAGDAESHRQNFGQERHETGHVLKFFAKRVEVAN
jgi:hypothetical protein